MLVVAVVMITMEEDSVFGLNSLDDDATVLSALTAVLLPEGSRGPTAARKRPSFESTANSNEIGDPISSPN